MTPILRRSPTSEARVFAGVGFAATIVLAIVVTLFSVVKPFADKRTDVISVTIDTPYVGEGVASGTPMIIHGVKVGQVTAIASLPGGGVRLNASLESGPVSGLTDTLEIDFRPSNYFGVTGVSLIPNAGGQPLGDNARISLIPAGNFSLQALLYRFGEISTIFDRQLISVAERATRYTDGLNPLLETMITVSTSVADSQTVGTAQLLRNATGIGVAVPGLADAVVYLLHNWRLTYPAQGYDPEAEARSNTFVDFYDTQMKKHYEANRELLQSNPDEYVHNLIRMGLQASETDLFSAVGKLESSHVYELFPAVELIRTMADVVPQLVNPDDIADKLHELRSRLERMYEGSGDQRALQVRVILDALPGVAAPLGLALGAAG